jgi:FkbM family methyltransferase
MRVGPEGQAVAFEPDPVAYRRLVKHVSMNKNLQNVVTFEAAASSETGQSTLYFPSGLGPGSACSHMQYLADNDMTETPSITIRTVAPDDLVESNTIRAPDFIKIDVQGHGAKALAGSINSIRKSWPVIAFSQHSEAELNGIRELLEPLGYTPVKNFSGRQAGWTESAVLIAKNHGGASATGAS